MLPMHHLFSGIIFSLILLFLFPQIGLIGFLIIMLSTVLIDVDHYLYYVYKKKDWSLKHAYNWFIKNKKKFLSLSRKQRNKFYTGFFFLHGIEILLILFLLGKFLSIYFYYILIGVSFHLFLDIIYQRKIHDRLDRISIIYDFLKFKKLRFIGRKR
ncbi:hypothetical protein ES703_108730 [subsurface metagenome]